MMNVILQRNMQTEEFSWDLRHTTKFYASHLVEYVIETLIEVFEIKQDHCSTNLHADLDLVDVPTHLQDEEARY